jgi:hypothetical protein
VTPFLCCFKKIITERKINRYIEKGIQEKIETSAKVYNLREWTSEMITGLNQYNPQMNIRG